MDKDELLLLVKQMREAQRQFFKTHSSSDLQRSKQLERRVDLELLNYVESNGKLIKQPVLFNT